MARLHCGDSHNFDRPPCGLSRHSRPADLGPQISPGRRPNAVTPSHDPRRHRNSGTAKRQRNLRSRTSDCDSEQQPHDHIAGSGTAAPVAGT
jgi:hypothetical protein